MNQRTAGLAAVCFGVAVVVRLMVAAPVGYWLPVLAEGVGAWLIYSALIAGFEAKAAVVLRLWGLEFGGFFGTTYAINRHKIVGLVVDLGKALLTIRHPASCNPRARSTIPVLSYTESSAMGMYEMYVWTQGARSVS